MKFLPDVHHMDWRRDLLTALAISVLPALILIILGMETSMIGVILAMIVMGVMSALAGYRIAPRDLWLTWIVAFVLVYIGVIITFRIRETGESEAWWEMLHWFVGVLIVVPMIFAGFVPSWTARLLRRDHVRIAERRKAAIESH